MGDNTNSAFELSGSVEEVGRLGLGASNPYIGTRNIIAAGAVTFRNRFPATPSSITLTKAVSSVGFAGDPSVLEVDRDGFSYQTIQLTLGNTSIYWHGHYTAIA